LVVVPAKPWRAKQRLAALRINCRRRSLVMRSGVLILVSKHSPQEMSRNCCSALGIHVNWTLARISHSTDCEVTVWATGSRFRADFVFSGRLRSQNSRGASLGVQGCTACGWRRARGIGLRPHWRCWRGGFGSSGIEGTMRRGEDCLVWTT
jgi:hypothetical protein